MRMGWGMQRASCDNTGVFLDWIKGGVVMLVLGLMLLLRPDMLL